MITEGGETVRDPVIVESWRRCIQYYGLDPLELKEAYIVPHYELRQHRERLEQLIRTARYELETLYKQIAGQRYALLLTDAKGVTVDYIGDCALEEELRKAGLYLGSEWSEARAGTCGVGSCIHTGEALTVHQTDHFDGSHIGLTCTAAPIYDVNGRLAAVLDISALHSPESQRQSGDGPSYGEGFFATHRDGQPDGVISFGLDRPSQPFAGLSRRRSRMRPGRFLRWTDCRHDPSGAEASRDKRGG